MELEKVIDELVAQVKTGNKTLKETVEELAEMLNTEQEGAGEERDDQIDRRREQQQSIMACFRKRLSEVVASPARAVSSPSSPSTTITPYQVVASSPSPRLGVAPSPARAVSSPSHRKIQQQQTDDEVQANRKLEQLEEGNEHLELEKVEQLTQLMAQYDTRKKTLSETVEELTGILKTMQEGAVAEESEEVRERRRKQEQALMQIFRQRLKDSAARDTLKPTKPPGSTTTTKTLALAHRPALTTTTPQQPNNTLSRSLGVDDLSSRPSTLSSSLSAERAEHYRKQVT
jgi:hypothetical protein